MFSSNNINERKIRIISNSSKRYYTINFLRYICEKSYI